MGTNIGLNVIEVDGSAPATIAGAATSVAAFNILTRRGVPNRPVRITSFAEFVERFGGYDAASLGAYLVKGFFDNAGRRAWVNRVTGAGANAPTAASAGIRRGDAANAPELLRLEGGYRGQADPGDWAEGLVVTLTPSFSSGVRQGTTTIAAGGATLARVAGFNVGDTVLVNEGTDRAVVTITDLNPATGAVRWTPDLTTPGDFAAAGTVVATTDFDLVITRPGDPVTAESWPRLTLGRGAPNYAVTALNDPSRGSRLIRATDPRAAADQTPDSPGREVSATLADGSEGTVSTSDFSGDEAAHTGFFAFDPLDVQMVCTERSDPAVVQAGLAYCERRGDCMLVGSVPEGSVSGGTAIEYGAGLQGKKVYGALYGPWITVTDPLGRGPTPVRRVPPTGHVMGVYARVETTRGIHKAPAGDEARLLGALDVEYQLSDAQHTDLVQMGSVNGVRAVPGAGIVVDASRTLSTDIRWRYVNVRLLFNYVKTSLRQGLRWVKQEPNRDQLWDAVKFGSVRPFLMGLWRMGAFGAGEPDEVFTIICDETNNPPDEVDKGNFKLEVYFYPSKPAETILIVVGQQPSGGSASEA